MESIETKEITFPVRKATDLEPFTINGTRHLGFHYFLFNNDTWHFLWVEATTDPDLLESQIQEGKIYIMDF